MTLCSRCHEHAKAKGKGTLCRHCINRDARAITKAKKEHRAPTLADEQLRRRWI